MSLVYIPCESDNYSAVSATRKQTGLYLGGQKDAKNRDKLQMWGVTHILNVTPEKESGIEVYIQCFSCNVCVYAMTMIETDKHLRFLCSFLPDLNPYISNTS